MAHRCLVEQGRTGQHRRQLELNLVHAGDSSVGGAGGGIGGEGDGVAAAVAGVPTGDQIAADVHLAGRPVSLDLHLARRAFEGHAVPMGDGRAGRERGQGRLAVGGRVAAMDGHADRPPSCPP